MVTGWKSHRLLIWIIFMLASVFFFLALFVVHEIIKNRCSVLVIMNNIHNLDALRIWNFLGITAVCHRFVFIIFQTNVTQLRVGHVFYVDPLYFERPLPLVLGPNTRIRVVIDRCNHLSNTTKVSRSIYREEQIDYSVDVFSFTECSIQAIVSVFCRTPNLIFNTTMNVILRIRFDYKESEKKNVLEIFRIKNRKKIT